MPHLFASEEVVEVCEKEREREPGVFAKEQQLHNEGHVYSLGFLFYFFIFGLCGT